MTFSGQARGSAVCRFEEYCEVLPSGDGAPGLVDDSPSSGRLWNSCGYPTVPRGPVPFGTQVLCLQGPISPSNAPGGGGGASSAVIVRGPGYGHRTAHASAHFHSCVGGAPGAGAGGVFSAHHAFTWTDGPPSRIVRQWCYNPGW